MEFSNRTEKMELCQCPAGCVPIACEETALGSHWLNTAEAAYGACVWRVLFWLLPRLQSGLPANGGAQAQGRGFVSACKP